MVKHVQDDGRGRSNKFRMTKDIVGLIGRRDAGKQYPTPTEEAFLMDINGYLSEIRALAASGQATEHSYRPALERLFKGIDDNLTVIN